MKQLSKYKWHFVWLVLVLVYAAGLFTPLMEVDESEYACISREMLHTGQYTVIQKHGLDYLDKPPLLFWLSAFSMSMFGISEWAYKLPTVLFTFLGFYSVYRLGKLYWSEEVGKFAALIQGSALAVVMMNQDVRTDALLCSGIVFGSWQLLAYVEKGTWLNLFGSALGVGMAMLAKGPIGLMIPGIVVITRLVTNKSFGFLFQWKSLIGLVGVAMLLWPMCSGLYQQFGWKGLRFYFWEQSFGRITGENKWRNDADGFFFLHTFLWAFLPHSLLLLRALWNGITSIKTGIPKQDWLLWTGFLVPFAILSLSHYKLPHYINVVIPFAALLTANDLAKNAVVSRYLLYFQYLLMLALLGISFWLNTSLLPSPNLNLAVGTGFTVSILAFYFLSSLSEAEKWILPSSLALSIAFGWMNVNFFYALAEYDGGRQMGLALQTFEGPIISSNVTPYNAEFYANQDVLSKTPTEILAQKGYFKVIAQEESLGLLQQQGLKPVKIQKFSHFSTSMLTWKFLNPETRLQALETRYILDIQQ
jgi:4-amino-4-deoxy-L-arabinose transferase-like glycosyltransferase